MKRLVWIGLGFVAGVVYCLYRDVFSKPVEPIDPDDEDTWNSCPPDERGKAIKRYYANGRPKAVNWRGMPPKPMVEDDLYDYETPSSIGEFLEYIGSNISRAASIEGLRIVSALDKTQPVKVKSKTHWDISFFIPSLNYRVKKTLADTQPVYVGEPDEVGVWQLEQFAKESE